MLEIRANEDGLGRRHEARLASEAGVQQADRAARELSG